MKKVVIGVSSSIAAFKIPELARLLKQNGIEVKVILTENAARIVDPREFKEYAETYINLFEKDFDYKKILEEKKVDHIEISREADLFVIAPATANVIGKIANGIADDFLTTAVMATKAKVLICPAMNVNMWNNPILQENLEKLRKMGYETAGPKEGMLACGNQGMGRMEEIENIEKEIYRSLKKQEELKNKRIIVTSGGTSEKIDEVRFITNRSSGKMGAEIADACFERGAKVLLLRSGNSKAPRHKEIEEKIYFSSEDLYDLIRTNIDSSDIIFHAAAVSDFKTKNQMKGKISSKEPFELKLVPQRKISDEIKKINPKCTMIAFKAEYGLDDDALIKASRKKIEESGAEAVVANDIGQKDRGFEADNNEVIIVTKNSHIKLPFNSKRVIASGITKHLIETKII